MMLAVGLNGTSARDATAMRKPSRHAKILGPLFIGAGAIRATLVMERPATAASHFEKVLAVMPNRPLSLLGAARAYAGSGDPALASEAYRKLLTVWQGRDQLEGFVEAQRFVTSASAAGAD